MSMAFESAEIALGPLAEYSEVKCSWAAARRDIAQKCDRTFAPRLTWANFLQRAMFMPRLQGALVQLLPGNEWLWRALLNKMR
jgi:hypothetical protein